MCCHLGRGCWREQEEIILSAHRLPGSVCGTPTHDTTNSGPRSWSSCMRQSWAGSAHTPGPHRPDLHGASPGGAGGCRVDVDVVVTVVWAGTEEA